MEKWPFFDKKLTLKDLQELYENLSDQDKEEFMKFLKEKSSGYMGSFIRKIKPLEVKAKESLDHIWDEIKKGNENSDNIINKLKGKIKETKTQSEETVINFFARTLISILEECCHKEKDDLECQFTDNEDTKHIKIIFTRDKRKIKEDA